MPPQPTREEALFAAALDQSTPQERTAWLAGACAGDKALLYRVQELLRAHEGSLGPLDAPPAACTHTVNEPSGESPGTIIGPYKLLQKIGEGGMGVVYMAEQTAPVERRVALKIIKPGMDTRQVIARFEAERQALAMMDHPNIAKVLDAGATDSPLAPPGGEGPGVREASQEPLISSGRPYFVMELVKGLPITQYCDQQHLTPRERLELFLPVCQAVQHAHQKGIIHRDLKPSNILVARYDDRAVPKIIDFGVAKAVSQRLTERTMFTQYGQIVGTIEYMSPEQAQFNQLDVDTRSDIYSLGVLLYELLTGETPFDKQRLRTAALDELLRIIREEEPPRPSARLSSSEALPSIAANRHTEPKKLTTLVRGELDWIVMRALEKDRARRYETANGFAQDLQRYLADEAVLACPPSAGYRLRKFVRRNKAVLAVAALVLFFLLLVGSSVGWAVRDRAARAAEAARLQAERQAKVAGQVESILAEVNRLEEEQNWPEALAAARRAEAAAAGGEAEAETAERVRRRLKDLEFIDRLEQIRMQRATWIEGKFDNAGADRDYARAFRDDGGDLERLSVEEAVGWLKARPALAIPLTAALDDWVYARLKVAQQDVAGWKRLVAIACGIDPEPVRDWLRSTWGRPDSEVRDDLRRLAGSIDIRAQHPATLCVLARNLQGVNLDSAIRILRDASYVYPGDFWLNYLLGQALGKQGDKEGAIRYYTAAVAVRPRSTAALNNLGIALQDQKRLDEAITCYRKAIEIDPEFAYAYIGLGNALIAQNKLDEAVAGWRKAIEVDPNWASAYNSLGNALRMQNKLDEATASYRKAIEIDPECANAYNGLGNVLRSQKKVDQAIASFKKAIELDPKPANPYNSLGALLCDDLKDYDQATECFRKAIELDPKFALAHQNLGNALRGQKKLDEAVAAYQKAIELDPSNAKVYVNLGTLLGKDLKEYDKAIAVYNTAITLDPKDASAYFGLGNALHEQKKLDEAVAAYRKAIEIDAKSAPVNYRLGIVLGDQKKLDEAIAAYRTVIELDPKCAEAHCNLGLALARQNKVDEAIAAYSRAIEINPNLANAYCNLGNALCDQKNWDEAIAAYRKAIDIDPKDAKAHNNLGFALRARGKLDEAVAAYQKAIDLDRKYSSAYLALARDYAAVGVALHALKKLEGAIAAYQKATELDPRFAGAHNNLGALLCDDLEDYGKASECFRKVIELDPNNSEAHCNLGNALRGQKKLDEAIAAYRKAVEIDPNSAHGYNGLAWLLATYPDARFRDPTQAVALARKAVELAPNNWGYLNTLGTAQYRAGDWKAAIAALEESMKLRRGGDSNDWFFLAMAHWQLGEKDKAGEWYDKAIEWMEKNHPTGEQLRRFRAEASQLLGPNEKK